MRADALSKGHNVATGLVEDSEDAAVSYILETFYKKNELLRGIPAEVIKKAWFTMAHLTVGPGALVLDMGCNPLMTYAMALCNPEIIYVGIDADKKLIKDAQKEYVAPNLSYRTGDITNLSGFEAESADAVINSFILHEIYSTQKYSDRAIVRALENHLKLLKPEGLMFINDYSAPPPEEYVLLEMPDVESEGEDLEELSEPELLLWFSENARPRGDHSWPGFFLEELPARFPQTRLFRLPYKWAYEFMMRKDNRSDWETELPKEYTFFTPREYRKNLRSLSARVLYTAPQWDDAIIKERFEGHFHLYGDDGTALGMPPTSFIAVAQKMEEKQSLRLSERRPSQGSEHQIRITAMRNDTTGEIFDIISRDTDLTEVLPYRITASGELNIFIHEGLPRGIANAVPRAGKQLDGKRWSGHMSEAISVPTEAIIEVEGGEPKEVVLFARDFLGLKPAMGATLERGPNFSPAPDFIDEHIRTRYLQVMETEKPVEAKVVSVDVEGFTTRGRIREISAQTILNAISVGYIPNARLEMQIEELFDKLGLESQTWNECPLAIDVGDPEKTLDSTKLLKFAAENDKRFKDVKGNAGKMRMVKSIFVDEGWVDGGTTGLAARDIEFVIPDDQTINKAVILPLTKDLTGTIMAGMNVEYLPIPQRRRGNGIQMRAPSITLPKEVSSIEDAKKFIAKQFDVSADKVSKMGESYFCHIGMTPLRIFPFCVYTSGKRDGPLGGPVEYAPVSYIGTLFGILDPDDFTYDRANLCILKKAYRRLGFESEVSGNWEYSAHKLYNDTLEQSGTAVSQSTVASGLERSGWTVEKSRENVASAQASANARVITSPDFADVHHDSGLEGFRASTSGYRQEKQNTAEPDHKRNTSKE